MFGSDCNALFLRGLIQISERHYPEACCIRKSGFTSLLFGDSKLKYANELPLRRKKIYGV